MNMDADTINIPTTQYDVRVTMPSAELTRIVHNLSQLGESVQISVSKAGVHSTSDGVASNGSVFLRRSDGSHITGSTTKPMTEEGEEEQGNEAEGSCSKNKKERVKKIEGRRRRRHVRWG
jgi:proliferating cell nuclear antigen